MPFLAAVTQPDWIATLKAHGVYQEVNFWRPGRQGVNRVHIGKPLVFVQKGKTPRRVPGLGIIHDYQRLTIREAWDRWGVGNGAASLDEFVGQITRAALQTGTNSGGFSNEIRGAETIIGCIILRNVYFFPDGQAPTIDQVLPDFSPRIVGFKVYNRDLPAELSLHLEEVAVAEEQSPGAMAPLDPGERDAIEKHAMALCQDYFAGWEVVDVSRPHLAIQHLGVPHPGYDLLVRRQGREYHVEVKGTKLDSPVITLTRNELAATAEDPQARLFVVSGIQTARQEEGWEARRGTPTLYSWVNRGQLRNILDAAASGEPHGLHLKAPEWSLDVHNTDFLTADETN